MVELRTIDVAQGLAEAAIAAGVKVVTCYPGTPGSDVAAKVAAMAGDFGVYMEWSVNERVALETAIGASLAGRRALVCTKSVGMNVLLDPLMVLTYTGSHGGLVILLGDDPGGYGSQNDQDTRRLALMAEIPLLEPISARSAPRILQKAFELSEQFLTPIIVRVTRTLNQSPLVGSVPLQKSDPPPKPAFGVLRDKYRNFPYPANAVALHEDIHARQTAWGDYADRSNFDRVSGSGAKGILAAGFVAQKLRDVIGEKLQSDIRLWELAHVFPLPAARMRTFLEGCESVLVLEEMEPFVEGQIKAFAQQMEIQIPIRGKSAPGVPREGEFFRWQIQNALQAYLPAFKPSRSFGVEGELDERPKRKSNCSDCPYDPIFDLLDHSIKGAGYDPYYVVDPGCLVTLAGRVDAKYAIGSAIAVADGLVKAGAGIKAVALCGDSAFFHAAIPALCNAAVNGSDVLVIVLNNGGTVTTGSQPSPSVGVNALGVAGAKLNIAEIAAACGVRHVESVDWESGPPNFQAAVTAALQFGRLALIELKVRCG